MVKLKIASKSSINNNEEVSFTKSQKIAVDNLIQFIADEFNSRDYVRSMCGAGGTGKTFAIKYVIDNCCYSRSLIVCAAPTHKACRVLSASIGGKEVNTIQSLLGLRLNTSLENFNPTNPQFDPLGKVKLTTDVKVLIIDEASMLPVKLVNYIHDKCRELSIKVIMIGDSFQLAPVNENKSTAFGNKVFYLKEVVRQEENNPIKRLLDILRDDIKNRTYNFLEYIIKNPMEFNMENKGYMVFNRSAFSNQIVDCFQDEEYTKDINLYRVIAYTNVAVTNWNSFIRNVIIKDANKSIITQHDLIMSYQTIVDDFNNPIIVNCEEYIIKDIIDFVDPDYQFKGMMVKFQSINGGFITQPLFIVNHFDSFTINAYYKTINNLINTAKAGRGKSSLWKQYYKFKNKYLLATNIVDKQGKILLQRDIDYGFAITSHKSQGSTYRNVFVDINDIVYDKNGHPYNNADDLLRRLYVACSRATDKLFLCYG